MEAQQCVKLSLTNRSIGLILSRPCKGMGNTNTVASSDQFSRFAARQSGDQATGACNSKRRERLSRLAARQKARTQELQTLETRPGLSRPLRRLARAKRLSCLDDLVAMARGQTPDPIPNSAVKTLSADGTASQDVGE